MTLTAKRFGGGQMTAIILAVAIAFCGLAAETRREALQDSWVMASQAARNLDLAVNHEIGRTIESLGLSLAAVAENSLVPGVSELPPNLRNLVLFDRSVTAKNIGVILVLNENGDVLIDPTRPGSPPQNVADREYFTYPRDHPGEGIHISAPYLARLNQRWVVAVSRRLSHADGSFAGVVMGTIVLDSIRALFSSLDLGPGGTLDLFRNDGIVLMRVPFQEAYLGMDISRTEAFHRAMLAPTSQFTAVSQTGRRLFINSQVEGTPLWISVSLPIEDIEATWRRQTLYTGLVTAGLVGALAIAALRLLHELRRRQKAEDAARESEASFRLLAENSSDMVSRVGVDGVRSYVSPASLRLVGRPPTALVGRDPKEHIHPDDLKAYDEAAARMRSRNAEGTSLTYRARHSNGAWIWIETTVRVLYNAMGGRDGFVAVSRDVTERKTLEAKLALLANLDGLTGIANRRIFDETLERQWLQCAAEERPISLLLIDIDHFKALNDNYGHQCGDECLRQISATLGSAVRRAGDLAARYGGEEFAILLPDTCEADALWVAERLRVEIEATGLPHVGYDRTSADVTVSIGVATLRPVAGADPGNARMLVDLADQGLYEAKGAGRNRVTCKLNTVPVEFAAHFPA